MFIASIPDLFFYNPLISQFEFAVLLLMVIAVIYLCTAQPEPGWQEIRADNLYVFLKLAWAGEIALWRIFWPFFILLLAVSYYIDYRVINITFTIASWKTVHGMLLIPYIWWLGSVWRCSANTHYKLAAIAARVTVIMVFIAAIVRLYLSVELAEQLFDCKLLTLEYGDC